ncbi:phage terminase large subunit family protein [Ruminococcaceae bacterium OttesenSCG-928-I18]|nr:phage terminase large subunit family protein [Ruminococcaceae bacterium OttesenSCG-928-I18]
MNNENKEVCPKCNHSFSWSNEGDRWPGGKDKEDIACPYCGNVVGTKMTSGYIAVKKAESETGQS